MMNTMQPENKSILFLILLFGTGTSLLAQAIASLDSARVETGNPITLHLELPFGTNIAESTIDFSVWSEVIPKENILGQRAWSRDDNRLQKSVTFICFYADTLEIPPLSICLANGDTLRTNSLNLIVEANASPDQIPDMEGIRNIYREPAWWSDYWPLMAGIAGILLIFYLLHQYALAKRRRKNKLVIDREIEIPPHQIALTALENLAANRYWQTGRTEKYYVELTHILRNYLERQYQIPVLESTTEELPKLFRTTKFPANLIPDVQHLLRNADLVKFAKNQPDETLHMEVFEKTKKIIERTASDRQTNI